MTVDELNAMQDAKDWQNSFSHFKPQPKKKKGFWTDQISTGGGIGGSVAGGAIGTAILPGIGTLAGALIGGALGGSSGQYIENGVVGEEDMSKDVLKEGLLNGVFAAGPIRGLSVGKALVTGAGREGVEKAITATPIRDMIANKTGGVANDLRRGVANTTKVADSFTQETNIMDSLTRNGLKGSAAKQYKNIDTTLGNISGDIDTALGKIKTTDIRGNIINNLQKNATTALPDDPTYTKEIARSLSRLTKGANLDSPVGPQELFAFKKELGDRLGNAFTKMNRGAPLTAKEEVDMALWKNLDDEITKMAPEVKSMTLDQSNLITARPGLQASSQKTLGIPLLGVKSQGAERVAQGARDLVGRGIQNAPKMQLPGNPLGPVRTAGRMFAGDSLVNAMLPGAAPDMENNQVDPSLMSTGLEDGPSAGAGVDESLNNPFGVSQDEVAQQMVLALQNGDKEAFTQLKTIYDLIGESASTGSGKPMGVEAQKMKNNAQAGLQSLTSLEQMIANDPSIVNKAAIPGNALTDSVLGTSKYRAAIQNVQDAMARLRSGASMTEQESARFDKMLPRLGDNPDTVAYKIAQFKDYFSNVMATESQAYGPTTLDEALTGGF